MRKFKDETILSRKPRYSVPREHQEGVSVIAAKYTADRRWERVLNDIINGQIDREAIVDSMDQSNKADGKYYEMDKKRLDEAKKYVK